MYFQQRTLCPIEQLPNPIYEAVNYVCQRIDAPPEVVIADAFAVASALTQRLYKVRGLNGNLIPTTLNTLSLAPTATGKGESYRMFFQSPSDFEANELKQLTRGMTIDDLLLQDVSLSALMSDLAGYGKSASIQLKDGYSFLHGPLMKPDTISKLTQAWSGPQSIKFGRHHGNKDALDPCLAIGLRIQPELFYNALKSDRGHSRHLGLWPRFMVFCYDPQRFPVTPWHAASTPSMTSHRPFMERLEALLPTAATLSNSDEHVRKVLVMDTYANARLRDITHWVKDQMHGQFHDIQDASGRAAENTLRLASNFHIVCHGKGPIPREMIERAWAFVDWSLMQFRNVFVHALQPPLKPAKVKLVKLPKTPHHQQTLSADMQFMRECIAACSYHCPCGKVPTAEVALLAGFSKIRFFKTLGWLITQGLVEIEGGSNNETIRLLPLQHPNAPYRYMSAALTNGL